MSKIIDFHAHAFPDGIAERAVDSLEKGCDYEFRAHTNGKASGLLAAMDAAGVEQAILCPIATKPEQFEGILQWVLSVRSDRLIPVASIHPQADDIEAQLKRVASEGLIGIKIHPMYQDFKLDDDRLDILYASAASEGLMVIAHCGYDVAFGQNDNADVERIARVLDRHSELTFIATHLGGWKQWQQSARLLAGRDNIWFESSASLDLMTDEQAAEIITQLGVERVMYGTDSPWFDHGSEINNIRKLGFDKKTTDAILGGTAEKLLGQMGS